MQIFLHDSALRQSCYGCPFRGENHKADLTLADFWGIEKIMPDFFDDKGTSLVIIQDEKGKALFSSVKDSLVFRETDFYKAVEFNPSYYKSAAKPKKREAFYKDFSSRTIEYLYKKYGAEPFFARGKRLAKSSLFFLARKILGSGNAMKLKEKIKSLKERA